MCCENLQLTRPNLQCSFCDNYVCLFFVSQVWLSDNRAGECNMRFPQLCVCVRSGHTVSSTLLILPPGYYHPRLSCHLCQINTDSGQIRDEMSRGVILKNHVHEEAFKIYDIMYSVFFLYVHMCLNDFPYAQSCVCVMQWFDLLFWPKKFV